MDVYDLISEELESLVESDANTVPAGKALRPDLVGMRIFDKPLVGVGRADDELFATFQQPDVVGPDMLLPHDWLPSAASVVSYFFPMSERVRASNREGRMASDEWFHARIEGQAFIVQAGRRVAEALRQAGHETVCPANDERMQAVYANPYDPQNAFRSSWSERHVAYLCGLGTFSLSRGIITAKGMAGRLGSVVTAATMQPTPRPYTGIYDYCTRCGSCVARCPRGAISLEAGKDHDRCFEMMTESKSVHEGYVGCGKCQVGVPCEHAIPLPVD